MENTVAMVGFDDFTLGNMLVRLPGSLRDGWAGAGCARADLVPQAMGRLTFQHARLPTWLISGLGRDRRRCGT